LTGYSKVRSSFLQQIYIAIKMSNKFKKLLQDSKELPSLSTKYDSPKLQHDLNQLNAESNLIASKIDSSKDNNTMG
jgi:hypothetical protein